jgi:hypothetical protein
MHEYIEKAERLNRVLVAKNCTSDDIDNALSFNCKVWGDDERASVAVLAARLADGTYGDDDEERQRWFQLSKGLKAYLERTANPAVALPNAASAESAPFSSVEGPDDYPFVLGSLARELDVSAGKLVWFLTWSGIQDVAEYCKWEIDGDILLDRYSRACLEELTRRLAIFDLDARFAAACRQWERL